MNDLSLRALGAQHQLYAALLWVAATVRGDATNEIDRSERDRGAVSLEQVLWFIAAGVSVAVIAGILWNRISTEATNAPLTPPSAP